MNNRIHVSFSILVSSGQVYAQELDCWVIWWFYSQLFKESPYCLPQQLYQFTIPPTVKECSLFSTPSPAFIVFRLFDDSHSDGYEVISHCSFNLHFSNNERCQAPFHAFIGHLNVFFGEMSVQVFFPVFDWVVFLVQGCMSCLYILEINPMSAQTAY